MSDDVTAAGKIIDTYAALLRAWPALADQTIVTDRVPDDAIENDELPVTAIYAEAWRFEPAFEQGETRHTLLLNFETLHSSAQVGVVSRANQSALAHVVAAIHSDRSLGGRLEDAIERDVTPPVDNGKSVSGASLQIEVTFTTPRGDHFTIVGVGGATF